MIEILYYLGCLIAGYLTVYILDLLINGNKNKWW